MIHDSLPVIVLYLVCINGAPIIARHMFKTRLDYPVDLYLRAWDGNRVLGSSKTIRGVLCATLIGALLSPMIGVTWPIGLAFGLLAMLGDSLASFMKRRLGLQSGQSVLGLDQLPEVVLPLLVIRQVLDISWLQLVVIAFAFLVTELFISPVLHHFKIRRRPR